MMAANQFEPDYAVMPGAVLAEYLDARQMTQAELARRCGRSAKLVSEIVSGKASIEPKTAIQFEMVLGVEARIWLGLESRYRLLVAREAEKEDLQLHTAWMKAFPVAALARRGAIRRPSSDDVAITELLSFFGVASVNAWEASQRTQHVVFRHSPTLKGDNAVVATWLRLGIKEADKQNCAAYNEVRFKAALRRIRGSTIESFENAFNTALQQCNEAGVALACVKPFPKTRLSGAAQWLATDKAVIQLSLRHRTDDHFWFTLFHEAAHILLHSKKTIFIDDNEGATSELESEADHWAADFLVKPREWSRFSRCRAYSKASVRRFANAQGIAPGIIVGRLQHEGLIPWSHLNDLKLRLTWGGQ